MRCAADLAGLRYTDIESRSTGLLVTIRRSKTDQEHRGRVIGIAQGSRVLTDPVAALDAWLTHRGHGPGSLFTRVYSGCVHDTGISSHTIGAIIRERAIASDVPAERITSHSLRAGHITTASLAGVPLERIAEQTQHRDLTVLHRHYVRPLNVLDTTSSSELGL